MSARTTGGEDQPGGFFHPFWPFKKRRPEPVEGVIKNVGVTSAPALKERSERPPCKITASSYHPMAAQPSSDQGLRPIPGTLPAKFKNTV